MNFTNGWSGFPILPYLAVMFGLTNGSFAVHVADFGAYPDDGKDDAEPIRQAVEKAVKNRDPEVRFSAGTYQLDNPKDFPKEGLCYLGIFNASNLVISGETYQDGRPSTRLERRFKLNNETQLPLMVDISHSTNITLRNLTLANNPPLGVTARVVSVNTNSDNVIVEMLPGLSAYDGMRCASAQVWNLSTGKLKRIGSTPKDATLTIGTDIRVYWQNIARSGEHTFQVSGAGFAGKVNVGDGISWHHKSSDSINQTQIMDCKDITFENIFFPNVSNMGMLAAFNHNLTFRRVRFEPENNNLAVGGRDGLHLSSNSGRLLVEDSYFKGLRMDPLVIRRSFGRVKERNSDGSITIASGYPVSHGNRLRFWVGKEPQDYEVTESIKVKGGIQIRTSPSLSSEIKTDACFSYLNYSLDQGIIRNCIFEDNLGSPIVNFEENMTVEKCRFDNNSYQIKYGPNRESGGFVRNNIFQDNHLSNTPWVDIAGRGQPADLVIHSLSTLFHDPVYNSNIQIKNNTFRNAPDNPKATAIHILNSSNVIFKGNTFQGFAKPVVLDPATTRDIRLQ